MIFVLESLLKNRQAKLAAWRQNGSRWVKERNATSSYHTYTFKEYGESYPSPVFSFKKMATIVFPILGCGAVVSLVIFGIVTAPPKKIDPNNPNDCTTVVKKGDKVAVQNGNFDGSEGDVIEQKKDCSVNLRLTKSTFSVARCKELNLDDCTGSKDSGTILNVDKSGSIIKL